MRRAGLMVALGALLGMLAGAATAPPALADGRGDGWSAETRARQVSFMAGASYR